MQRSLFRNAAVLVVLGSGLGALAAATEAQKAAPEGFGKLLFGTNVAQARAAQPEMQPLPAPAGAGNFLTHPKLARFVLSRQKIEGLADPVEVELRFWEDRLWTVIVYSGSNSPESVRQSLERTYGKPSGVGQAPTWVWPTRTVNAAPDLQWFSVADKDIGRSAQAALMESLRGAPQPAPAK